MQENTKFSFAKNVFFVFLSLNWAFSFSVQPSTRSVGSPWDPEIISFGVKSC